MSRSHFVVLGLAPVRSVWFREVSRWSTSAAIPTDFVRCVSVEELRARLASGRSFSALLIDAGTHGLDRDLIDVTTETGAAVVVVDDSRTRRDWLSLGATAVLPEDFDRAELVEELERHGRPLEHSERALRAVPGTDELQADWSGRLVAVTGGSGAGSSTVAMGLAQGLASDPRYRNLTLLADCALHADLAMLHDARDIVPGLQEIVDAHRAGTPSLAELRTLVFDVEDRGYHLLLGLRRHRDWAVLRPRAVAATIEALARAYRIVVADMDPDLEGEAETGSIDIEERNLLSRSVAGRADLTLAVGTPTMKGLRDLLRVIDDLTSLGTDPARILPVINRSSRSARTRAQTTSALGELLTPISSHIASPIHIPDRRRLNDTARDCLPLPTAFAAPIASAVGSVIERLKPHNAHSADLHPVAVAPGSLGHFTEDELDELDIDDGAA